MLREIEMAKNLESIWKPNMNREQYQKKFKLHHSKIEPRLDLASAFKSVTHTSQESIPELQACQIELNKRMRRF